MWHKWLMQKYLQTSSSVGRSSDDSLNYVLVILFIWMCSMCDPSPVWARIRNHQNMWWGLFTFSFPLMFRLIYYHVEQRKKRYLANSSPLLTEVDKYLLSPLEGKWNQSFMHSICRRLKFPFSDGSQNFHVENFILRLIGALCH